MILGEKKLGFAYFLARKRFCRVSVGTRNVMHHVNFCRMWMMDNDGQLANNVCRNSLLLPPLPTVCMYFNNVVVVVYLYTLSNKMMARRIVISRLNAVFTIMPFFKKQLPSYSTERFYLLSEIEELCQSPLQYIESEDISPSDFWKGNSIDKYNTVIVYILWDTTEGKDGLYKSVQDTLGSQSYSMTKLSKKIIVIEAMIQQSEEMAFPTTTELELYALYIQKMYKGFEIIFGVSNNATAAPGLEAIYEYLRVTIPHYSHSPSASVVTLRNENYLGGNVLCEPDAVSGVCQYVLSTLKYNWVVNNDTESEIRSPTSEEHASKQLRSHVDITRIHAVFFMLFICIVSYYWSK